MNPSAPRGIERHGLDSAFEADEVRKANLILEGQMLVAQKELDAAAERFAQAAYIEERLSELCAAHGMREKSWVHSFSAASCWAQAGNFYEVISLGEQLLRDADVPPRLRLRVEDFIVELRQRRVRLMSGLVMAGTE